MTEDKLRFPIGRFKLPKEYSAEEIKIWIENIELFPSRLHNLIDSLDRDELEKVYRKKGWTIRQLVHHCADSHMNSLIRFKLALTEDSPTIKAYYEDRWGELFDYSDIDLTASLKIIEGVHYKLAILLKSLIKEELERDFYHPENKEKIKLWQNISLYSWHSNHHLAHVKQATAS